MNIDTLQSLLKLHREDIYRFVRFLGAQPADADDLVQETFLAAFSSRKQPKTSDPAEWGRWLRGIARNMFLRLLRNSKHSYPSADISQFSSDEEFWNNEFSGDSEAARHLKALEQCLESLTDRNREAVEMRYRNNSTREEIAEKTGLSMDGVKSMLRKIRSTLGECIQRHLSGDIS